MTSKVLASLRRDWLLHLLFLVLVGIRIFAIFHHEIWRDEALFFLRAREADSLWTFINSLRYERSLALWPVLLFAIQKVGLTSVFSMQILHLCLSVALLGILIYGLRRIPVVIRGLAGASYLLMYEYTAISRSYILTALLLVIFLLLELRTQRAIIWKALVLFLMATSNIFGTILAVALSVYLFFRISRDHRADRVWLVSIMIVAVLFCGYLAWLPGDVREDASIYDYRGKAFTLSGIPRAFETINHVFFDGFFFFPQVTNQYWWSSPSIFSSWLSSDYRIVYVFAILLITFGVWILLKLFRVDRGLAIAGVILLGGNLGVFALIHPGHSRHLGIVILGVLALFVLAWSRDERFSLGKFGKVLLFMMLTFQAASGLWAVYADGTHTFSQGVNVARWLEKNYPDESLIIYPDYAALPIVAYKESRFLALESREEITFVQMDDKRTQPITPMLVDDIKLRQEGQLLITAFPFSPRIIDGRIAVEYLKSFVGAMDYWEGNYHVYSVRPVTDLEWHFKWVPYEISVNGGPFNDGNGSTVDFTEVRSSGRDRVHLSHPEDGFNNATGSTAEARLKLLLGRASEHDASLFSLQDGTREAKLSFFNDRVEVYDANTLRKVIGMDTTDDFHTYRSAVIGDTLDVFVDGETVASVPLQNKVSSRAVLFGDASASEGENINALVEYIAYSTKGALTP